MGSNTILYVDEKTNHPEQCLSTEMPSSQFTWKFTSSSPSASSSVSTSTTSAPYASDKTPKFSTAKDKQTYNMFNPAPVRFSLMRLFKRLFEMFSTWPALLMLMVCFWFVLPCRFEKNHGREGVNLRGMKWIAAEDGGFHYVGRWYNNTAGPGMEMTFEGGYIDILHNSSRIFFTYGSDNSRNIDLTKGKLSDLETLPEHIKDKVRTPVVMIIKTPHFFETVHQVPGHYWKKYDPLPPAGPGVHYLRVFSPIPPGRAFKNIRFEGIYIDSDAELVPGPKRKLLEVVTDTSFLNSFSRPKVSEDLDMAMNLKSLDAKAVLSTVHIWPYMLADYFNADVRIVGVDGRCLEDYCEGMNNLKDGGFEGMRSSYFRQSPLTLTTQNNILVNPHSFSSHPTPDLIITAFGQTTYLSTLLHPPNVTYDAMGTFRNTYASFLRLIRTAAYPVPYNTRSSCLDTLPCPPKLAKNIPIFALHPPQTPQISRAITIAVESVTKSIIPDPEPMLFDLRTFDWIPAEQKDLYDEVTLVGSNGRVLDHRLSLKGHWEVANALKSMLCEYLADNEGNNTGKRRKCTGLPMRNSYDGEVVNPNVIREKDKKEKELEWRLKRRLGKLAY